ncbi:MAG: EpsG family protein [Lactobacillus sp.]|nr:EpsG family protein [Lactobacillus sp.]
MIFLSYLTFVSTDVPDFANYQYVYQHINPNQLFGMGKGWYMLNDWGRNKGWDYPQFKTFLVFISLLLIFIAVRYFLGKNYNLIWGLYLFYPALLDIIQVRFFVTLGIFIFALIFLFQRKWWSIIIYVLLITLAVPIHSSAAFYYLFVFVPFIEKRQKVFSVGIFIGTILLVFLKSPLQKFISMFASTRQQFYFESTTSLGTLLLLDLMVIVFYFITYSINNEIVNSSIFSEKEKMFSKFCVTINLLMLVLIPMGIVSPEFLRVQRASWLLFYMLLTVVLKRKQDAVVGNVRIKSQLLGMMMALFGFGVLINYLSPLVVPSFFN